MDEINVKIFVTHTAGKDSEIFQNEIFHPIQNNTDFDQNDQILSNSTGDNISPKNDSYCELCTQYWVWKNVDADYYGFCHYRRFFSFASESKEMDCWSNVLRDYLNEESMKEFKLHDICHIREEVEKYDVIAVEPADLRNVESESVYEQYKVAPSLHIEDIDLIMSIIERKYPEYYPTAKRYIDGQTLYLYNMFIMRRELFQKYSAWLFDILAEFDLLNDMTDYSIEGYRTPGHLGERLFSIFITYLKESGQYRIGERQIVMFKHPERQVLPTPFFPKNNIPIVLSTNEFFAKFTSVAIRSMMDCSNPDYNYDIVVLVKDVSENTKVRLQGMVSGIENISLRFFDVGSISSRYHLSEGLTMSVETYFRLVIPECFAEYDKVLYLDGDIIVRQDVAKLYQTDMGDNLLAGVIDVINAGEVNGYDKKSEAYSREKLQLENILTQIDVGILLINCSEFRKNYTTKFLLNFVQAGGFQFQDKDALNILCEGRIKYLDPSWNFFADSVDGDRGKIAAYAPRKLYRAYREAANNPRIIHYAGNEKPWWNPDAEWADYFWEVFMRTPFYNSFIKERTYDVACEISTASSRNNVPAKKSFFCGGIICLKENGLRYTIKRMLVKLSFKN